MKLLAPPTVDNEAVLELIAEFICDSTPPSAAILAKIKRAYASYQSCQGNPHLFAKARVPRDVGDRLKRKYSEPLNSMTFIEEIRYKLSPDSCPMCGSSAPCGTIDHYLPQKYFPELAVFSWNLIPACGCNSLRGTSYKGAAPGQRPLHPYFDQFLNDRILFTRIIGAKGNTSQALTPDVKFLIDLVDPIHPSAQAIKFHVDEIINKTNIDNFMNLAWGKIIQTPNHYFGWGINKPNTKKKLVAKLNEDIRTHDFHASTPNNWRSMLVYGILQDDRLVRALFNKMQTSP